jgi:hypothetical protein
MEDLEGFLLLFIQKVRGMYPKVFSTLAIKVKNITRKNGSLQDDKNKKEGHKRPSFSNSRNSMWHSGITWMHYNKNPINASNYYEIYSHNNLIFRK